MSLLVAPVSSHDPLLTQRVLHVRTAGRPGPPPGGGFRVLGNTAEPATQAAGLCVRCLLLGREGPQHVAAGRELHTSGTSQPRPVRNPGTVAAPPPGLEVPARAVVSSEGSREAGSAGGSLGRLWAVWFRVRPGPDSSCP